MDAIRLLMLTGCFLSAMLGGLYATGGRSAAQSASTPTTTEPAEPQSQPTFDEVYVEPIPPGIDVPAELLAEDDAEVFTDGATGVRMGPLTLHVAARGTTRSRRSVDADSPFVPRPRRAAPGTNDIRLDADPGRNVILTARGMMARGETVRGSCYAYLSEVFDRAGNDGWRTRQVVYQAGANGPYADLDLIQPGDWLYIVNNPDSTPVGTHSVLFLGWEDRANGYARTISHPGWSAGASAGREGSHDLNRTYRIIRPRNAE